jgi:SAM-dependent methyltransferase
VTRLPDEYFTAMYDAAPDPWHLAERWYEARKYGLTMGVLSQRRYRHAFEPGCSVGVLTTMLAARCDRVTATDVVPAALDATRARLRAAGADDGVTLRLQSLDEPWPGAEVDLVVLSEVAYYLSGPGLMAVLERECPRLADGTEVVAVHWRHAVVDYPQSGDDAAALIAAAPRLRRTAAYVDDDVTIDVFVVGGAPSVAGSTGVPGVQR